MPFKSKAQRRLFYAKADKGEISKDTVKKWEKETTDKNLPEKVAFWHGFFEKMAANTLVGGSFFSGRGKGNLSTTAGRSRQGAQGVLETTTTDKTLLDRDRTASDFDIRSPGKVMPNESIPKLIH